jgi:hypothetical protein
MSFFEFQESEKLVKKAFIEGPMPPEKQFYWNMSLFFIIYQIHGQLKRFYFLKFLTFPYIFSKTKERKWWIEQKRKKLVRMVCRRPSLTPLPHRHGGDPWGHVTQSMPTASTEPTVAVGTGYSIPTASSAACPDRALCRRPWQNAISIELGRPYLRALLLWLFFAFWIWQKPKKIGVF